MAEESVRHCSSCGSKNLKGNVPINKLGVNYFSGIVLKTEVIKGDICLDCGRVNFYLENPEVLTNKEIIPGSSSNYLPFILFALFILSLQLD